MRDFEKCFKRQFKTLNEDKDLINTISRPSFEQDDEEDALVEDDTESSQLADEIESDLEDSAQDSAKIEDANMMLKGKIEKEIKEGNNQIATWASALEEFATFINDASNEESIKHIIDNAAAGSALAAVKKTAASQMTKVATDCVVLAQTLKSLIGSVSVEDVLGL